MPTIKEQVLALVVGMSGEVSSWGLALMLAPLTQRQVDRAMREISFARKTVPGHYRLKGRAVPSKVVYEAPEELPF